MLSVANVYFMQYIGFDCAFIVPVNKKSQSEDIIRSSVQKGAEANMEFAG
jgi:hypothetical protein